MNKETHIESIRHWESELKETISYFRQQESKWKTMTKNNAEDGREAWREKWEDGPCDVLD